MVDGGFALLRTTSTVFQGFGISAWEVSGLHALEAGPMAPGALVLIATSMKKTAWVVHGFSEKKHLFSV